MFDVGFSEMIVIAIVALIVIGPEKLPKVARTLGLLAGRMQRYVSNIKSDIEREMQFEDLQKLQQEIRQGLTQTQSGVYGAADSVKKEVAALERDIESSLLPQQAIEPLAFKSQLPNDQALADPSVTEQIREPGAIETNSKLSAPALTQPSLFGSPELTALPQPDIQPTKPQ